MRILGVVALSCLGGLMVGGCTEGGPAQRGDTPLVVAPDNPEEARPAAILEGALRLEDGCLLVVTDDEEWVPVFPESASWANGALQFAGRVYAPGDPIAIGGGETGRLVSDDPGTFPDGCPPGARVWTIV